MIDTLGGRLKQARENAGLSVAEAARRFNVVRDTIYKWESNASAPKIDQLKEICSVYRCDSGHIFGEYEEKTRPVTDIRAETGLSPEAIEVLQALKKYSKGEELRLISNFIVFPVNDSILDTFGGFSGELLLQALNDILYQFKLLPADGIKKAGYFAILQRLFNDFIEEQLKKPLPVDEDEEE